MPRRRIRPRNVSRSNQCLPDWVGKCCSSSASFSSTTAACQRDEDVRPPEVAVDLGDLVLEDQVVPERVPSELAREPVILMEVVAGMGEHELGIEPPLQLLEHVLDLRADVGKKAVPKAVHLDPRRRRRRRGTRRRSPAPPAHGRRSPRARPSRPRRPGSTGQALAASRRTRSRCRPRDSRSRGRDAAAQRS